MLVRKLIILDFFLRDNKGHDQNYDFSVARQALHLGIDTEIWCPKRNANHQPDFVRQCLGSALHKNNHSIAKLVPAITRTVELRKIFTNQSLNDNTVVLVPTIDSHFLVDLTVAAVGLTIKPKVIVVLRRGLKDHIQVLAPLKSKARTFMTVPFIRYLHSNKAVVFISDSELITDELKADGFSNACTLPIPHLPPRQKRRRQPAKIAIGYFGGARYDKGFDLLPNIVDSLLQIRPDISFVIQSFLFDSSKQVLAARKRLDVLGDSFTRRLALLDGYLSNEEYIDNMKKCSIVLIPYRKELYGRGTSGILAEAIACGAWAVVPSGTWMSAQKSEYSKIVTFDEHTPQALLDAISKCIESEKNIDQKQLKEQIDRWYAFHCPQNYIRILQSAFQQ